MLNVFINTWGNYNENGADGGEWITLPMDPDELEETLQAIAENMGDNDPEFCIHDYESSACYSSFLFGAAMAIKYSVAMTTASSRVNPFRIRLSRIRPHISARTPMAVRISFIFCPPEPRTAFQA